MKDDTKVGEVKEVEEPKAPPTYLEYAKEFVNGNSSVSQAYALIAIAETLEKILDLMTPKPLPDPTLRKLSDMGDLF